MLYNPNSSKLFHEAHRHERIISLPELTNGRVQGFIVIHKTVLGVSVGGTRILKYSSMSDAYEDALRLSEAMTYKCAIAGLPFGGGKGVIIASPGDKNFKETLRLYANVINDLRGQFYTGEDVGLTEAHVKYMLQFSPYFIGKPNGAGDPSKYAALSAFNALGIAVNQKFGNEKLTDRTIAIKGVGKTGGELLRLAVNAGMKVFIADVDTKKIKHFTTLYRELTPVDHTRIHSLDVDIYAPCALGPDITEQNVNAIKAKVIVGTANNQLGSKAVAEHLLEEDILYVPDFLANAGGLINVADELLTGGYNSDRVLENITKLNTITREIIAESKVQHVPTEVVAKKWAERNSQLNV